MDAETIRMQRRDELWGSLLGKLDLWKNRPFAMEVAYHIAALLGAYRILGGTQSLSIVHPVNLAETALEALRSADFPARYHTLEKKLAAREKSLSSSEAIACLQSRMEAQFAYLAVRDEIVSPDAKDLPFHRSLHLVMRRIVEAEDDFFDRYAWAFFKARDWIDRERTVLGPASRSDFAWLWTIPEAAEEAWRLPLPVFESVSEEEMDRNIDFRFVTRAFGEAFDPPIAEATRARVLDRLSHTLPARQRLAAKADSMHEESSDLMERLVRQLGVFRILPKEHLPGFFVRLKRDRSIEFLFRDEQGLVLSAFEGAQVEMGGFVIPIRNGTAIVRYDDLVSLYDDMANLDERLVIVLADGTRETRFLPR